MTLTIALMIAVGTAVIGMIAGFFLGKFKGHIAALAEIDQIKDTAEARVSELNQRNAVLETRLAERNEGFDRLREQLVVLTREKEDLQNAATRLKTELEGMEKLSNQRKKDLDGLFEKNSLEAEKRNQQWADKLREMTRQQMEEAQKQSEEKLSEKAKLINEGLKPVHEGLKIYTDRVNKLESERKEDIGKITTAVEGVILSGKELAQTTSKLTTVLSNSGARGKWGEMQLRNVVEHAGMLEHCDFDMEVHVSNGGSAYRPDMIINMSGGCKMIVDAKTPLDAYAKAINADDDAIKSAELTNHVHAVRAHIKSLAAKKYWEHVEGSPDYVILFMPAESIFYDALAHDPQLMDDALKQKVFIASPITLMALLRTGHAGWQMFKQNENIREIALLGEQLYKRFDAFLKHLQALGKKLSGSIESYNKMVGSYERSVEPCLRKFPELGVEVGTGLSEITQVEVPVQPMLKGPESEEDVA